MIKLTKEEAQALRWFIQEEYPQHMIHSTQAIIETFDYSVTQEELDKFMFNSVKIFNLWEKLYNGTSTIEEDEKKIVAEFIEDRALHAIRECEEYMEIDYFGDLFNIAKKCK